MIRIMDGKFIVFYGINSLGKSTQAEILIDRLEKNGRKAEYLKYPVYELQTGKDKESGKRRGLPYVSPGIEMSCYCKLYPQVTVLYSTIPSAHVAFGRA